MTKQEQTFFRKFFKGFLRTILYCLVFILLLFASIIIALQFPSVQTKLVHKATDYLSKTLKYPIKIEAISISWFDVIDLQGVQVKDLYQNEMIYLDEASVDFSITSILDPQLNIDEIILSNGKVKVLKLASDSSVNITNFINAVKAATKPKDRKGPPAVFTIDKVTLNNMFFSYDDERKGYITEGFDHFHFSFEKINSSVSDLRFVADSVQFHIEDLTTVEKQTAMPVKKLKADFLLTKEHIELDKLNSEIGNSKIGDYVKFEYETIDDLSYFNDKVTIIASLDSSVVYSRDLAHFAPDLNGFEDYAVISGGVKGQVVNFGVKDLKLSFGRKSFVAGKASFKGLPDFEETYIDFKFSNAQIAASDLKQYIPAKNYPIAKKFQFVTGSGEYVGFKNDFVAHGKFETGLGKLDTDINFKISGKEDQKPEYKGKLKTYAFHLGKFLDIPEKVHLIDMDGTIEGEGLNLTDASLKLDARISRIGLNKYDYRKITTNARLSQEFFDGLITVNDPNLSFSANGKVDLHKNINRFDIQGVVEKANLKPLNLSNRQTFVKGNFVLNFTGLEPDEITGDISLKNTYLLYEDNKEIFIDSLFANSLKRDGIRTFTLRSDLVNLNATGDFEFSSLSEDLAKLYKEYQLNFENDKKAIATYYKEKGRKKESRYDVAFNMEVNDINKILEVYVPGMYFSEGMKINGEFSSGYTSILNFHTRIDTFFYKENEVHNVDLEVSTSKLADSSNVLAMVFLKSNGQAFKSIPKTENLVFEGMWNDREILFTGNIRQKKSTNEVKLKGSLSFAEDKRKILQLSNSSVSLLNQKWRIADKHKVTFSNKDILFENFFVTNNNQEILLNGTISHDPEKEAEIRVKNFNITNLNPLISPTKVEGTLNGDLVLKNIYKDLNFGGEVSLDSLLVDKFLIGDISGKSTWNKSLGQLDVIVDVLRDKEKIIRLNGHIKDNPENNIQNLNLDAYLDEARLEILNPLFKGVISEVSGKATGKFKVTGSLDNIIVNGRADVTKGKFKVDYLGTTYNFEDYIYLEENLISFNKLRLKDNYGDIAVVDGGIYHDNFNHFLVKMKGYMDNFQVLNTTEKDNELFYGTAFVTGNVELDGTFENLEINANATSNKGTKIFIPITGTDYTQPQEYIQFVSHNKETKKSTDSVDISGIKMNFNLDITPDAYAEIIFDKRTGDIIRGNGSGHLKLEIDTRGDFYLYGNYQITKGAYNFTLANLINKEFTIQPSSSISWFGDPYQGVLDIDATYRQTASLKPLIPLSDSALAAQEGARRYPVDVLLGIEGNLLSPTVHLDIDILNYSGGAANYVTQFNNTIESNEQELNRQVFSLLVLGGFSAQNSFTGIANSTSNLSELFTNQLGNWLSQVDENLQIDMDLSGLDREDIGAFNLRLSYTLLDGRLRISRNGSFTNVQNTNQNDLTNIAGEWTVEYLLAPDGKLRLKLYNKNNQNQIISNPDNQTTMSAGFSILHTESFNSLDELFKRKKKDQEKNLTDMGEPMIPEEEKKKKRE